jgi:hypothetical protein
MDEQKIERLRKHFQVSDRFMWGILPGDQKEGYKILEKVGLGHYYGGYDKVTKDILNNYRNNFVEVIKAVKRIINDHNYNNLDENSLKELRNLWNEGTSKKLNKDYLDDNHIHHELIIYKDGDTVPDRSIFFETDSYTKDGQTRYVFRWSEFAKIWFHEDLEYFNPDTDITTTLKKENQVNPTSLSETQSNATVKLFNVLEKLPYNAKEDKNQQMTEKIFTLMSLSAMPETKPIFDLLANTIDFSQLIAMEKIKEKNPQTGETKDG